MCIATSKSVSSVGLLGIQKDDKLTFDFHIRSMCRSDANELSVRKLVKSLN